MKNHETPQAVEAGLMSTDLRAAMLDGLKRWTELPDDVRNGERPWLMGWNAGYEFAQEQSAAITTPPPPSNDLIEKLIVRFSDMAILRLGIAEDCQTLAQVCDDLRREAADELEATPASNEHAELIAQLNDVTGVTPWRTVAHLIILAADALQALSVASPREVDLTVSNEDAIKFLETACRNWDYVRFSREDVADVAGALSSFLRTRTTLDQG